MPAGACLRLAPVGGRPEEGELGTVSAAGLGLSQEEATALATAFDTTLGDGAISMHAPDPRRWYLHGIPEWAGLAEPGMGSGAPAEPGLMRLLSEIEMLFFQHPVNRTRAETGRTLITGVQAWGGGRLPGRVPGGLPVLAGGEPWLRGLAALAGSRLETDAAALGDGGLAWPVPPEEADETLPRRLDEAWCAPLLELLGRRRLRSVALVTRRQVFSISPVSLRLPWRRRRSLQEALC